MSQRKVCVVCNKDSTIILTDAEETVTLGTFLNSNALIQDVFPLWPPEKREQWISGTHPSCWVRLFGTE
jgi:hypothetical protein